MKRILGVVIGALLAGLLLTGCKKEEKPIQVAITDDIVSLDLAGTKDTMSEIVGRCVFATLYTFNEDLELEPCLAVGEERRSDLEWVFYLRKDAKFHDGSSITASDVVFSLERAMTVDQAEKSLLIIDKIEAVDAYTVKVTTREPCVDLKSTFVRVSTSIMSEKAIEGQDYDFNKPVGSGAFQVVERKKGEYILLERFGNYFAGPAKSKYLKFVINPSEQNRTASLLNHTIDLTIRVSSADSDYLKLEEGVRIYEHDSTKMELLTLNSSAEIFSDSRVRQAVFCAIDRQKLMDNVVNGYGTILNSMLPSSLPGAIEFEGFTYNKEKAEALLKESGYEDGFSFTVLSFDELRKQMLEYIKLDLAQVGIHMDYEFYELEEYLKVIEENKHMATLMSWTSNPDPDSTFSQVYSKNGHVTVNHSRFTDERVEQLLLEGKKESDEKKRREIYEKANEIVASSYKVLPLYQPDAIIAAGSDIEGIRMNAQGIFGYESIYRVKK